MVEAIIGLVGFLLLSLVVWFVDTAKKAKDYYDGDN